MNESLDKVKQRAIEHGFEVEILEEGEDYTIFNFIKPSPQGRLFGIMAEAEHNNISYLLDNLRAFYSDFDINDHAMGLYLDNDKNKGLPFDEESLYKDTEDCIEYIVEMISIVMNEYYQ